MKQNFNFYDILIFILNDFFPLLSLQKHLKSAKATTATRSVGALNPEIKKN